MRRLILGLVLVSGCAGVNRRPRWEISLTAGFTDKINSFETVTTGITLKRPIVPLTTGSAQVGVKTTVSSVVREDAP